MNRFLLSLILLALSPMFLNAQVDETKPTRVSKAIAYVKSAPLSELAAKLSPDKEEALHPKESKNELWVEKWPNVDMKTVNNNVQTKMGNKQSRGPAVGFAGQGMTNGFPPDTDGDVSETHFIQVVNSKYNVYLKDGTKVLGPLNLNTLWASLPGGPWGNDGDPIVLWDENAGRWLISQFDVSGSQKYELIAVSESSDPLGSYHLYVFSFGTTMNDYPKLGVWRDAYYATYNMFQNGSFTGSRITALERDKILVGDPDAAMIEFHKSGYYATMPADIDGENLPESGEPCPIMYINNSQKIQLWDFHVDWDTPSNSSLNLGATLTPSPFSETPNCNGETGSGGFITQPGTSQRLDGLGGMIMNRLAYRMFDDHESMVVTHSIRVNTGSGNYRGAIRWYEFRKSGSDAWSIYQEGTYAPDDNHRWMGSAAMNINGDIAIAYSVSNSDDIYPSIRYTGRRSGDPLGEMTVEEVELKTGTSNQNHWRWGDYSCLNVDPDNDTVFWYTTEYNGWKTWVSSFDLGPITGPSCNAGTDAAVCTNDQFQTSATGSGVLSMLWTTDGDGFFSPANQYNTTYIRGGQDVNNGGCTLTLTVTGYDGTSTDSDDLFLSIIPKVSAGDDVEILETEAFTCQGSTNAPDGVLTWTTSGSGIFSDAGVLTPIYTPSAADIAAGEVTLSLEISISEPCNDTKSDDMVLTIIPVGIDEINIENKLSIYPNPTNDIFTLSIDDLTIGEDFTFYVYTSYGKEIYRQIIHANSSTYERVIDMSDFVGGIYFVSVTSDKGSSTMKLVKE